MGSRSVLTNSSLACLVLLVLTFAVLEVVIFLVNVPEEWIIPLWYAVLVVIILIVITWIVYRHSKNKDIEAEIAEDKRISGISGDGSEPRIGHTYKWKED